MVKTYFGSSSHKGTPKETNTTVQTSQKEIGKLIPEAGASKTNSQFSGDNDPPEKNQKLKFVCEASVGTPMKKRRASL